ncbi:MAG: 7-cyano-7-deazaguanine synthase QueC [Candidatus Omnitrophica bacterium]|nr:7-cyano-7-deazaguanine synthase QueC [Candidatus Omnitrophota bacterium]
MKKAIVLLSGGLDSATTLYVALDRGYKCYCLIFDYGQRHKKEVLKAEEIARLADCDYETIKLSLPWRGSSLLDENMEIPSERDASEMAKGIPSTYVPARNTIFISLAAGWSEAIGADSIFIGANAVDYSGYPDCRGEYFEEFNRLLKTGTRSGSQGKAIKIEAPLIDKEKSEIIRMGNKLAVPYELTWSCYEGGEKPCARCDSCVLRKKGFDEAGLEDPLTGKSHEPEFEGANK